ncbi:MAG: hypothetical protein LBL86_11460 [Coriobacteriales bacterium]|jgi:predicted RNA-binding Zn-ribbon protein involved in translation (DUF1610 family)|nr:hypothetical protein [Coriobacteriales bacterium]
MRLELFCPACGVRDFDFDHYEGLVLLAPNLALVHFACPGCGVRLSVTLKLTTQMQHEMQRRLDAGEGAGGTEEDAAAPAAAPAPAAAADPAPPAPPVLSRAANLVVGDGDLEAEPLLSQCLASVGAKAHLKRFRNRLESIATVDDAIAAIDAASRRERHGA